MGREQQQQQAGGCHDASGSLYRLQPHCYIHVLDQTTNVTRVEVGPQTFIRKDNEKVLIPATKMVIVPPRHYCVVRNPVVRDAETRVIERDNLGQVKLQHAETEIRLAQDPFPLYPGEDMDDRVTALTVVQALTALRLKVTRDFVDDAEHGRTAGEEYLFEGPGTYIPRKEVEVVATENAVIVMPNEALKMSALRDTVDRDGSRRVAGEEWMVRRPGSYLPGAYEKVVRKCSATILSDKTAVHVKALRSFSDQSGIRRKNGEEYLITLREMESFISDVYEEVVGMVNITTLTVRQYCVIVNPHGEDGKPQLGHRKMIKGEKSFFLQPGEQLEAGIQNVYVFSDDEGLVLKSLEAFHDESVTPAIDRQPGDRWMLKGPMEYIPPVQVVVVAKRKATPLHENEGIYVRNTKTGSVRAVIGQTYMLGEHEELWTKKMPVMVSTLLNKNRDAMADRGEWINPEKEKRRDKAAKETQDGPPAITMISDHTRVITFQVPHNAAVQIYDYKSKRSRVVFGPDLVMLDPNEEFTQLSLSGGKPKKANLIRAIALLLGPDFCSDIIIVETSDHARLQLQLSYNWNFDVQKALESQDDAARLFCVPDFIGDMCKAIASRIRGAVSGVSFDDFHKNSAGLIKLAVFGVEDGRTPKESLRFEANQLVVTSIDIKSVEPVDQRTRDSLQKSVTLAIEITTSSQEATAKREAERVDQEARGRLERQRIQDEAEAEKTRKNLLNLQAESAAVESTGQAKAEAYSRAEAARIEAEAAVLSAKLKAEASKIEAEAELERLCRAREAEISFMQEQNRLEISRAENMSKIETDKFKHMVDCLGSDTIQAIATGPQDHQVRMLQSLGLSSTLITDGRTPINLLNTANGLLGGALAKGTP
jgi:major vault protein